MSWNMLSKKALVLVLAAGGAVAMPGCRSMSSQGQGALIGGLLGAGGGYAIGHHRGNRTNSALMGAGIGALGGYLVGDLVDDNRRANAAGPETIYGSDRVERVRYVERGGYGRACDPDPCDPRW